MHPEWSIIILTVLAGIAEGLLAFIVAGDVHSLVTGTQMPKEALLGGSALSVALAGVGVLASFFHLHHKARGIKAIVQWKFSWLSREVILLPTFIALAFLYGVATFADIAPAIRILTGLAGIATGLALGISSGMIYASIPHIREWGSVYTPINFVLLGLASGGALAVAVLEISGAPTSLTLSLLRGTIAVTFVALFVRVATFYKNATIYTSTNRASAIGVNHPDVEIIDFGSAYGHYNTKEYYYGAGKQKEGSVFVVVMALLFFAPLGFFIIDYSILFQQGDGSFAPIAALLMVAGGLAERWLFFVQANHIQNLYYGLFPENNRKNPILQKGKKTGPLPPEPR